MIAFISFLFFLVYLCDISLAGFYGVQFFFRFILPLFIAFFFSFFWFVGYCKFPLVLYACQKFFVIHVKLYSLVIGMKQICVHVCLVKYIITVSVYNVFMYERFVQNLNHPNHISFIDHKMNVQFIHVLFYVRILLTQRYKRIFDTYGCMCVKIIHVYIYVVRN